MSVEDIDNGSNVHSDAEEHSNPDSVDADSAEEYQLDVGDNNTSGNEDGLVNELDLVEEVVVSTSFIPVAYLHDTLNVHK